MLQSRLPNFGLTLETWKALKAEALPANEAFIDKVISVTAAHFNVPVEDIISAAHNGKAARARHTAIYIAYNFTLLPDEEVTKWFSREKAAVNGAHTTISFLLEKNPGFRKIFFGIVSELAGKVKYDPLNLPGNNQGIDNLVRDNKPFVALYGNRKKADADSVAIEDERARALDPVFNVQAILEKARLMTQAKKDILNASPCVETPLTSLIIRVAAFVLKASPSEVCGTRKASRANDAALYYARKMAKVPIRDVVKSRLSGGNKAKDIAEQVQGYEDLIKKDSSQLDKINEIHGRVRLMMNSAATSGQSLDTIPVPEALRFVATPTPRVYNKPPAPRVIKQAEPVDTDSELREIDVENNLTVLIDRLENKNIGTVEKMVPLMAPFGFNARQIAGFFGGVNIVARNCNRKLIPTIMARAAAEVAGFANRSEPYTHLLKEPSVPASAGPHTPRPKKKPIVASRHGM